MYDNSNPDDPQLKLDDHYSNIVKKMHDSGDAHKLALMDIIMGNHDRHAGNFMVKSDGSGIGLIDNALAFDYGNVSTNTFPSYLRSHSKLGLKHDKVHKNAADWIKNLDEKKVEKMFTDHGFDKNSKYITNFKKRLSTAKDLIKKNDYSDLADLLYKVFGSTGNPHGHPDMHEQPGEISGYDE